MKRVLSLLMAFVFLQVQTWALSGGPYGSEVSGGTLTGTYAGVLVPQDVVAGGSASIGLFTLVQPDAGLTTGTISVFVNGAAFSGSIQGVMDPKDGAFNGVIDAASTFQIPVVVPGSNPVQTVNTNVFAQGNMEADVSVDPEPSDFSTIATTPSRIEGEASVDVFYQVDANGTPVVTQTALYDVSGFKQSD